YDLSMATAGRSVLTAALAAAALACGAGPGPASRAPHGDERADVVLRGGVIVTMDDDQPRASALAVRGERVVAVGADDDMARFIGPGTRVVELGGRMVTPGLVDGHCHLYGLGGALETVSLRGAASAEEAAGRVARAAAELPPGEWV